MDVKTAISCEVAMKVAFYDLDPLQIVWHGHYLKYFDITRAELFDQAGVDLFAFHAKTGIIFPIIRTAIKHIQPLRPGNAFICRATVKEASSKIVCAFEVRLSENRKLCARGTTEQVAVRAADMEMQYTIPEEIRRALGG